MLLHHGIMHRKPSAACAQQGLDACPAKPVNKYILDQARGGVVDWAHSHYQRVLSKHPLLCVHRWSGGSLHVLNHIWI